LISGFAVGLVTGGSAVGFAFRSAAGLGSGVAVGLVSGAAVGLVSGAAVGLVSGYAVGFAFKSAADSGQFYRYCWCFWTQNDSFSTFDDTQSKSFLHLPAFLKIQHSFSNEENCKKRDHADRRRHISCSIGFVAFCLIECKCRNGNVSACEWDIGNSSSSGSGSSSSSSSSSSSRSRSRSRSSWTSLDVMDIKSNKESTPEGGAFFWRRGCNAHIIRLADIQRVSKNHPRGSKSVSS